MNKKDKEEVAACKKLVKSLKKGYGADCPELNIECGSCKAQILIAHLEWHIDNLEWFMEDAPNKAIKKRISKTMEKLTNLTKSKSNGIKKSKAVGKF